MGRSIPGFLQNSEPAFEELKLYVRQLELNESSKTKAIMRAKAILLPGLYILFYFLLISLGNNVWILYCCYFLLGVLLVFIFLNLIHDAAHQSLFKAKWANNLYVHFFDLMGANSYVWSIRHRRLHHNFPNVMGWDSDIEQSDMARIFPHGEVSRKHRNQHRYLPFLYPLYLFNWLVVRDFKDFFDRQRPIWRVTTIPPFEYVKLFLFKALYFFNMLALPIMVLNTSWYHIVGGFLLMLFTASTFSLVVLLSPHANTQSEFPLPDNDNKIPHTWFRHQLLCTNDVVHDNFFVRMFMASFNFHVIHHLFPSLNHVHYPKASAELKRIAQQNDLPYRSYPLIATLQMHYALLKKNGTAENVFEETM